MTGGPDSAPWTASIPAGELDRAVELLQVTASAGGVVVVAAHVSPDGDALGAALALHLALSGLGAASVPTVGEQPLKVPAPLAVLPAVGDLTDATGLPAAADVDLLVTVDASSPDRLGTVAGYLDAGVPSLVLDHHTSGAPFGDVRLIAPHAAATVQIVELVLERLGVPVTVDIATCLYAGLVTDTGRFGHANTDASAMEFGARLLAVGVDHATLTRRLYDTRSLGELRLLGRALERACFVPDVALIHTHLTHEELSASGSGLEATEALIDLLRSADVAEVALVLNPIDAGPGRHRCGHGGPSTSARSPPRSGAAATRPLPGSRPRVNRQRWSHRWPTGCGRAELVGRRPRETGPVIDGVLVVDKPAGPTSHAVVQSVRRAAGQKRVGHTGTLDPAATGVLVVCLGRATKLVPFLQAGRKTYAARMVLGVETDSQDADGVVVARHDASHIDELRLCQALTRFQGDIEQIPPMVSALKVDGERLHAKARRGEVVEREARRVTVDDLVLDAFVPGPVPEASFLVTCSAGTYIRTIAHDVGRSLGVGGSLTGLRRLANGPFTVDEAHTVDEVVLAAEAGTFAALLIDPLDAVRRVMPTVELDDPDLVRRLTQGARLPPSDEAAHGMSLAVTWAGRLIGIYRGDGRGPARAELVWTRPEELTAGERP